MVDYLRAVDTPYFLRHSQTGELSVQNAPSGEYELQMMWHDDNEFDWEWRSRMGA